MMVNPQWLQSFATLAELGNFTRSAERLNLTQAAVSQHIRHLEGQFGNLFVRHHRHVELTPAGHALLHYHKDVERAARELAVRLNDNEPEVGEISIITPGSIGLALYPLLLDYQQAHRGLTIRHRFAPDSEVLEAVLGNHYELGIVTYKPDNLSLRAEHFLEEPLELILPAAVDYEGFETLKKLGFIDHPDGTGMATRLLSRRYPGSPPIRQIPTRGFSNQVGLILEPVARGLGFTILPRYARQAFSRPDELQVIECGNPIVDTLWLISRSEWTISPRARRMITEVSACLNSDPAGN